MEQPVCKQCRYFIQHYGLSQEGRLCKINCGHCIQRKLRNVRPERKSCGEFQAKEAVEEQYVTKKYLRKELLKKVLNMELLPEELEE